VRRTLGVECGLDAVYCRVISSRVSVTGESQLRPVVDHYFDTKRQFVVGPVRLASPQGVRAPGARLEALRSEEYDHQPGERREGQHRGAQPALVEPLDHPPADPEADQQAREQLQGQNHVSSFDLAGQRQACE
jgi:hypothetical protein